MPDRELPIYFQFFNEIGIIEQLSRALLEARMPKGLIAPHFAVLNHLIRVKDGRTPLELARAFQVPKTSMSHTLAGLEKNGFIVFRPNPADGRSKCVFITDPGRAFRDETIQKVGQSLAPFMERFQSDHIDAILPDLTEMRKFLDDSRN